MLRALMVRPPTAIGRAALRRCSRHPDQQNGSGSAQGPRPNARAALRHLDGKLRQRRWISSLQLQRRAGAERTFWNDTKIKNLCRLARTVAAAVA